MEEFLRIPVSPSPPRAFHRRILKRILDALRDRSKAPEPRLPANYVMSDRSLG